MPSLPVLKIILEPHIGHDLLFRLEMLLSCWLPAGPLRYLPQVQLLFISPVKKMKQYALVAEVHKEVEGKFEIHYTEKLLTKKNKHLENETIGYYEEAAVILKKHKYQKISK